VLVVNTSFGHLEGLDVYVGGENPVRRLGIELFQKDRERVGLGADGAARAPDAERPKLLEKGGQDLPLKGLVAVGVSEKLRDVDGDVIFEVLERRVVAR